MWNVSESTHTSSLGLGDDGILHLRACPARRIGVKNKRAKSEERRAKSEERGRTEESAGLATGAQASRGAAGRGRGRRRRRIDGRPESGNGSLVGPRHCRHHRCSGDRGDRRGLLRRVLCARRRVEARGPSGVAGASSSSTSGRRLRRAHHRRHALWPVSHSTP